MAEYRESSQSKIMLLQRYIQSNQVQHEVLNTLSLISSLVEAPSQTCGLSCSRARIPPALVNILLSENDFFHSKIHNNIVLD